MHAYFLGLFFGRKLINLEQKSIFKSSFIHFIIVPLNQEIWILCLLSIEFVVYSIKGSAKISV